MPNNKTGRKQQPLAQPLAVTNDLEVVQKHSQAVDILASVERTIEADQIEFSQQIGARIGRRLMVDTIKKFADVSSLAELQHIKDSKKYKDLRVAADGKVLTIRTWEEFCELAEGRSRQHVDEDLANFKAFGADMLESFQRLGMGYRQMRDLRAIPADSRVLLIEAAKAGDQVKLLEAAEDLIERHTAEKAQLEQKVDGLTKKVDDISRVVGVKEKKNTELAEELVRAQRSLVGEAEKVQLDAMRDSGLAAEMAIRRMVADAVEVLAGPATEAAQLRTWQAVEYVAQVLAELISINDLPVEFIEKVKPHWLADVDAAAKESAAN